jgi:L-rhamnose mutarotase
MNRYVLTLDLREDPTAIAAYREYHAQVWPEVVRSLTDAGVTRMDIYLLDRRLVMILELQDGLDLARVFERHASSSAKVAEWEQLMKSLQQRASGAREGEWWAVMEPVFHLSAPQSAPASVTTEPVRTP